MAYKGLCEFLLTAKPTGLEEVDSSSFPSFLGLTKFKTGNS